MQQLSVIGIDGDTLVLESGSGERFGVAVSALPDAAPAARRPTPASSQPRERKASPREIQALIRGGMTAEQVSTSTGEPLASVTRFEGPVLAERAHVLRSALSIPVASADIDPLAGETTFGAAIEERLDDLHASQRSWAAWKDAEGGTWTVRLRFTTEGVEHEADWGYEAKKATLTPRGKEATSLSQSGDASSVLVPRLRAIDRQARPTPPASGESVTEERGATDPSTPPSGTQHHERPAPPIAQRASAPDAARFDSDAFRIKRGAGPAAGSGRGRSGSGGSGRGASPQLQPDAGLEEAIASAAAVESSVEERGQQPTMADNPWLRRRTGEVGSQPENVQAAAINRPAASVQPNHTAELLDALRRRRSEREDALRTAEEEPALFSAESTDAARHDAAAPSGERSQARGATGPLSARKRGSRAAMPSWDDIVFGQRTDD